MFNKLLNSDNSKTTIHNLLMIEADSTEKEAYILIKFITQI